MHTTGYSKNRSDISQELSDEICSLYGENFPAQQVYNNLLDIISPDDMRDIEEKIPCAEVSKEDQSYDPQVFLYGIAELKIKDKEKYYSIKKESIDEALSVFIQKYPPSNWNYWLCLSATFSPSEYNRCDKLKVSDTPSDIKDTYSLMELRALLEISEIDSSVNLIPDTINRALDLDVEDALDAYQIARISFISGKDSPGLKRWVDKNKVYLDPDGFVRLPVKKIGKLSDTYLASRLLEEDTEQIIKENSLASIQESVNLAEGFSIYNKVSANLMQAVILNYLGILNEQDIRIALDSYNSISGSCPFDYAEQCIIAADAAKTLDPNSKSIFIETPKEVSNDKETKKIFYKIISYSWAIENYQEWVDISREKGFDPFEDVKNSESDTSLILWAAAARNVFNHQIETEEERQFLSSVNSAVGCEGSDRLVKSEFPNKSCDLEATTAYYLSGLWG
ncbi:hypothetical protein [Rothia sp. 32237D007AR]